jgi:hypothetical protein
MTRALSPPNGDRRAINWIVQIAMCSIIERNGEYRTNPFILSLGRSDGQASVQRLGSTVAAGHSTFSFARFRRAACGPTRARRTRPRIVGGQRTQDVRQRFDER